MSLAKAIELIRREIPAAVAEAAQQAVHADMDAQEVTVPGFAIWHVSESQHLRFVLEHRLIGCETVEREAWLKTQLAFLDQAVAASAHEHLWQSYCTTDSGRVSFLVDVVREAFCAGPFP
jgi:hypothetical protein